MDEQITDCKAIIADLVREFSAYPPHWFTSNIETVRVGQPILITIPYEVARILMAAYVNVTQFYK